MGHDIGIKVHAFEMFIMIHYVLMTIEWNM